MTTAADNGALVEGITQQEAPSDAHPDIVLGDGAGAVPLLAASGPAADALWENACTELRNTLSEGNFSAWFGRVQAIALDGDRLLLGVPSSFARDWIHERYLETLEEAMARAAGRAITVELLAAEPLVEEESEVLVPTTGGEVPVAVTTREGTGQDFHPKYTFDSFVIGASNRFAHAAALAVAEAPAEAYNPLFIYGAAGLGKTHLLHAIGHYVRMCHSGLVVRYVSTEQFMNDFILALRQRTIPDFHQRYRRADLLLIDDIQFLEGKERTQEEFFHTFNALHPKSQIIITSDRAPKKISTLEERLRTRFE